MSFSGENSVIPLSDSDQEIGESRAISYDPRWGSDRVKASYIRPYHTLPRIYDSPQFPDVFKLRFVSSLLF